MYSGEVNVYENQISKLLELAETLGIKGLTEINNEHVVRLRIHFIFNDFLNYFKLFLEWNKKSKTIH